MNRSPSAAAPRPGRFCPLDYSYRPADFARPPELHAEVLYVAGGLYGNLPALDAIEGLAAAVMMHEVLGRRTWRPPA